MEELGERVTKRQKLSPEDEQSLTRVTDEVSYLSDVEFLEASDLLEENELEETPSNPRELEDLKCGPMEVPPTLSRHFSILHVLDLSYTEIKSLPQSISRLVALQKLFLRSCEHLMELPPEIGELTNLEVLDLEGTEILCLPKEIAKLVKLTCLKVSFYGYASQTVHNVIPRRVLSNLSRLIELIIDVSPYGEWWDVEVEAIIDDLRSLKQLETLKLYLPLTILLEELKCMFPGLPNFRFTVGRHEEHFISRLPHNVEEEFNNLEKGLKYMNGSHIPNEITKVFKPNAFFLQRHWTAKSLSDFGHENINEVKFCLVMECNEFRTIIDSEQFYQGKDAIVLGSLERLIIRYLKNVESIWKGPVGKGSLSNLKSLVVFTCPNLTTLLTIDILGNLSNLEELIVEDCPKIESIVSLKSSGSKSDLFLPSLKKISLIDVPELVSISGGLWIAPKLERMVILYCPKLEKLCTTEVSSTKLKVIKGEKEWWDALKWYESDLSTEHGNYLARLFIPLGRDGDLMAQLTKEYGQGKVGSFNIRDPASLFSEEEHSEEISLEESDEETPSNPREILDPASLFSEEEHSEEISLEESDEETPSNPREILAMDTVTSLGAKKPVVIFSKSTCCMSHSIKTLISSCGAKPMVYELDELSNGQQLERELVALGLCPSVPAVFIGNELVGGSREVMRLHLEGKLVQMLRKAKAIWL
ncbi:hypothetical protein Vadar_032917 [Vaccinium darrowii]|uniref:Uncharacterized protein n=1 Tax=Vaccinium darrowii TaxID=229202 RepID=A0ACB7X5Y6_9ERIC|nr:hypothetical protein Vadar_032917 [Vaccinium darrowii]